MTDKALLLLAVCGWIVAVGAVFVTWKLARLVKHAFDGLGLR